MSQETSSFWNRLTQLLSFLTFLTLTCCAFQPAPLTSTSRYKTVAVISLLPETFSMSHQGFTVFQNHFAVFPVDFDPNQTTIEVAINLLSQNYQVRDLGLNRQFLMSGIRENYSRIDLDNTAPLVSSQLQAVVKPGTVDAIIVFDASMPDPVEHLSITDPGMGLYSRGQFGVKGDYIGVIAPCEVFDGQTFKEIALTYAGQGTGSMSSMEWIGQPYSSLSGSDKNSLKLLGVQALQTYVKASLTDLHLLN